MNLLKGALEMQCVFPIFGWVNVLLEVLLYKSAGTVSKKRPPFLQGVFL